MIKYLLYYLKFFRKFGQHNEFFILLLLRFQFSSIFSIRPHSPIIIFSHSYLIHVFPWPYSLLFLLLLFFYELFSLFLSINKSQYSHIQNFIRTVNSKRYLYQLSIISLLECLHNISLKMHDSTSIPENLMPA